MDKQSSAVPHISYVAAEKATVAWFIVEWVVHNPNGRDVLRSQTCSSVQHGIDLVADSKPPAGTIYEIWQLIDGSGSHTRLIHRGTVTDP